MKYLSCIVLFLFVSFLSMPTIVTLIEKNTDSSIFYSFSEEDLHKDVKEIKANLKEEANFVIFNWNPTPKAKIIFENVSKHDTFFASIFSPPPELV
jgi:hypothetical protein